MAPVKSYAFLWHSPICHNLHHISVDENQTSVPKSTLNPEKWIGQLVAAVILAEGIWGLLASLTSNLVVPLLARVMDGDPQSPSYAYASYKYGRKANVRSPIDPEPR